MSTNLPQQDIFSARSYSPNSQQPLRGVGQDKGGMKVQREASQQPDPAKTFDRATKVNNEIYRTQKRKIVKQRAEKATTWLNPLVKKELERTAGMWGLSLSKVISTALEEWVQKEIHNQHEALFYPKLRQIIREERRAYENRIVKFLMRTAFASEQSKILTSNVLDRILRREGVTSDEFDRLVDQSRNLAWQHIIQITPQLQSRLEEWENASQDRGEEAEK